MIPWQMMLCRVWQAGSTNEEEPNSDFVDDVKNILKDPEKREDFFQVRVIVEHVQNIECN